MCSSDSQQERRRQQTEAVSRLQPQVELARALLTSAPEVERGRSILPVMLGRCSDEDLMELWVASRRSGQRRDLAFRLLWERHSGSLRRAIKQALGLHRALADEVFQETWFEVTKATSYTPGAFRAFIRMIALRKVLDRLALATRNSAAPSTKAGAADDATEQENDEWPGETIDPARAAEARQGATLILEEASTLPESQRRAWFLRFVDQCTFEEIGAAMGSPLGTAKTRVRIAAAAIRRGLRARGIAWGDLAGEPDPPLENACDAERERSE